MKITIESEHWDGYLGDLYEGVVYEFDVIPEKGDIIWFGESEIPFFERYTNGEWQKLEPVRCATGYYEVVRREYTIQGNHAVLQKIFVKPEEARIVEVPEAWERELKEQHGYEG